MSILGLWIWLSLARYCIGYVINRQPAEYYSYQEQPYDYQWQPLQYGTLDYPPTYYNSYHYYYPSTYNYPEYYKPYPKYPVPIQYGSYHYNSYPSVGYEYPVTHKPYSHKSDLKECPSYDEGQKLLQVYRLIREIELCRSPPKKHKKVTSLDKLVQKLTDQSLQHLLVEVVCDVKGYEKVAELDRCYPEHHSIVNDYAQLLAAIQKALNALDVNDYHHNNHYQQKNHGCCDHHKELCKELRYFRDKANELTVAQIKKDMVKGIKDTVKQAFDTNILEDLDEELESRLLDLETLDIEVPAIEHQPELPPKVTNQEYDQELLAELAELAALEKYLQQQLGFEPHLEKSQDEPVYLPPTPSTTYASISTTRMPPTTTTEEVKASWIGSRLGSLLGETHLLPGYKTIDVGEPAVLIDQPVTTEKDKMKESGHGSDVGSIALESESEKTNSGSVATHFAPLWLTKNSQVENKESEPSFLNKLEEMLLKTPEHRQETEDATERNEEEAREVPFEVPLVSESNAGGPTRFDLLKVNETTPELAFIDKETSEHPHNSAESRNQQSARQVVKQEVMKVLNLLEEAFPELNGHVSDSDVDRLVDGLRSVETGIKWTEMLSAVQKMLARKKLSSGEQILDVLEHWKEDEEGQLNNGYFERTYGGKTPSAPTAA